MSAGQISRLQKAIEAAESSHMNKSKVAKLNKMAPSVEKDAASAKDPADSVRMHGLADVLKRVTPAA